MAEKVSRRVRFKKFLKRSITPTWLKHISYQIFSFVVSVCMVIGVASYAITKSYDERKLKFVDGFTITCHTGSFDTDMNSIESVKAAIKNNVDTVEFDVRQRPDGTLVMAHDIVVLNSAGALISDAFKLIENSNVTVNLDIKETRTLNTLHDLLIEYHLYDRVYLTGIESSDVKALRESTCRDLPYYLNYIPSRTKIFSSDYQTKLLATLEDSGAIGINCRYNYAGAQLAKLLHKNGYKLSVWTVDRKRDMKRILTIQPDNITTKEYALLNSVIDNWGK